MSARLNENDGGGASGDVPTSTETLMLSAERPSGADGTTETGRKMFGLEGGSRPPGDRVEEAEAAFDA
jgi:hypothetical protein